MYKVVIIIAIFVWCVPVIDAQDYIPYRKANKWGYCDTAKRVVVVPEYDSVGFFEKVYSGVKDSSFSLSVVKKGKLGAINDSGRLIVECKYDEIRFQSGIYVRNNAGDYWNLHSYIPAIIMEKDYTVYQYQVLSGQLDTLWSNKEESYQQEKLEETKIVMPDGFYCYEGITYEVSQKKEGLFYLYVKECSRKENPAETEFRKRYTYHETVDTIQVQAKELKRLYPSVNKFLMRKETGWGLINATQKEVIEPIYDSIVYASNISLFAVKRNRKWQLIRMENEDVVKSQYWYDHVEISADGFACIVKRNNKWGVFLHHLNKDILIGAKRYKKYQFLVNLIEVKDNGNKLVGYVNYNGTKYWD